MTKYIGITIGPIDRITTYVKSAHSIWASSYIFSFLAKHIILHLIKTCKIKYGNFITPVITKDMFEPSPVGRFPDQYVISITENANAVNIINETYKATNNLLKKIAQDIVNTLKIKTDIDTVQEYLKRVIKVYVVEKSLTGDDSDVVRDFQDSFAAMECFDTYQQKESRNYLAEYFQSKTESKTEPKTESKTELLVNDTKEKQEQANNSRMFSSILECSAQIEQKKASDYEEGNNDDSNLKTFQKYIAFVAADGDNFGKTIAKLGEKSKYFTDFSSDLRNAVYNYDGQTIFQGGDDILFFAPIHNPKSKLSKDNKSEEKITDIFSLIKHIDDLFEKNVLSKLNINNNMPSPSLSYGIAIAYYKHPMNETRQRAIDLLHKCKYSYNRNAIAWEVRKHSGQTFRDVIDKKGINNTQGNVQFDTMLSIISNAIDNDINNDDFLHSITHWIISHKEIIESVILKNTQKKKLLGNYFDNNFNEDSHKSKKEFIESIRNFLLIENLKEPCAKLHAILRYVELLINKS